MGLLEGRIAVITGGAQGLGYAIAQAFVKEGANVVLGDVNAEGVAAAVEQLDVGDRAVGLACNVTSAHDVDALVTEAKDRFGSLDIMVNNAGITRDATMRKMTEEQFDQVIDVHLKGCWLGTRAACTIMREQESGGSIINVSSGNGFAGSGGSAAYGAAKSGTVVLTKYIATQYGKRGIRCNTLVPGWTVDTGWTNADEDPSGARAKLLDQALEDVCMPALATPDDIAPVVAFLASDAARYLQAATIDVNGGLLAHMPGAAGRPTRAPRIIA